MSLITLNDIFFRVIERGERVVMMHRQPTGWASISSQDFYSKVAGVARALQEWGVSPGDRVAVLGENRAEWAVADFATLLLGAVTVPIYPSQTAEQTAYILRDSGARVAFVSNQAHLQKVLGVRNQTSLQQIVIMDASNAGPADSMELLMRQGEQRDAQLESRARAVRPSDLATIIYTSGTTGVPKGAMLTHGNMTSNLACSLNGFVLRPGGLSLSFLPLSHVTARHLDFAMLAHGVVLAYVPHPDQLSRALFEVRPTIFVAVPRVYEKIFAEVELKARGFPKHALYRGVLSVGRAHQAEILAGGTPQSLAWRLADRVLHSKVRAGLGGRVELFISGGAPLGRELAEWYADIGIRIHEGYGLTETSPVIALNSPRDHKLGTVGKPLSNVEVRIAEDGEILVRGPSVFQGYWNRPEETKNAFVDGWFKTGDIGKIDEDGFLSITDRKKDLIKTSGGKFIAPQPLENSLKHNPLIAEAVIVGEKHKFVSVLIAPSFPVLQEWAQANKVSFSSPESLVTEPRVQALYEGIIEELNRNLAQFEKIKRVLLMGEELSAANGLLTASMKLRRRAVEERYREKIEEMYAKVEGEGPGGS